VKSENGQPLKEPQQTAEKQKPAHEFRLGRIWATVWANHHADQGTWYSVSITRGYMDGQGKWHRATTFGRDDLLLVAKVADLAHTWIVQALQEKAPEGAAKDVPF
jgi:hypothetical protein